MFNKYEELPDYLKEFLEFWEKNQEDARNYAVKKIPALQNKTIIEVMNENAGEKNVVDFLNRAAGKFGVPATIEFKNGNYAIVKHA
jgi:uncharacterized protein (DUF2384 family)